MKKRSILPSLSEVQTYVNKAAWAIVTLEPAQWTGWAVYLLEVLDNEIAASNRWSEEENCFEQRQLLTAVRDEIEARLKAGRW